MDVVKLKEFCQALSKDTKYSFLEAGKDDDELKKVAEKRGITLPALDLAVFKGVFAFTEKTNLNGCSLPTAEVEKSLHTLVGKAIDFDHIRNRIVGFWADAELIGNTIFAYGIFFKGNLGDDYELVKELLSKNQLGISFEAYGNREFKDDDTYDLKDIEWAGGGLLINTKPAFPGAGVIEMASQKRILELANTMTEPTSYIKSMEDKKLEQSRLYTWDMETIMRMGAEIECPMCKAVGCNTVNEIDFKENSMHATCWMCNCDMEIEMTPKASIVLKDTASRTIKEVTKVEKTEEKVMSKVTDASSTALIKDEEQIAVVDSKADVAVDDVANEQVVEGEVTKTIDELVKEAEAEVTSIDKVAEVVVDKVNDEVEAIKAELATIKAQLEKARDEGKLIGQRRSMLGEYAKDMSDDDVLDAVKFENASLRKKVAELESKGSSDVVIEKSSVALEVGSKTEKKEDEIGSFAKNVRKLAFNL